MVPIRQLNLIRWYSSWVRAARQNPTRDDLDRGDVLCGIVLHLAPVIQETVIPLRTSGVQIWVSRSPSMSLQRSPWVYTGPWVQTWVQTGPWLSKLPKSNQLNLPRPNTTPRTIYNTTSTSNTQHYNSYRSTNLTYCIDLYDNFNINIYINFDFTIEFYIDFNISFSIDYNIDIYVYFKINFYINL